MSDNNKPQTTITKEKIADILEEKLGLPHTLCEEITHTLFNEIVSLAKAEKKLTLKNFGKFYIKHKDSRPGLNIRTKDVVTISPRDVLKFTPSGLFRNKVNGNEK